MKRREKPATAKTEEAVAKGVNYEITIADIARRSERRAWWIAFSAILMAIILACGYFLMLPLKEKVPFLVMADAYTGTATVAKLRGDFDSNTIFSSEAINKSNVSHYVVARESFDRESVIRRRDWTTVNAMSSPDVQAAYRQLFSPANPNNLATQYTQNEAVRVNLISVQLTGTSKIQVGKDAPPSSATVRFQRLLYNKQSGGSKVIDTNIAAIQFVYRNDLSMDEGLRTENPLGFWVTSYRVDKELIASPPPTTIVDPTTAAPAVGAPGQPGVPGVPGQPGVPAPATTDPAAAATTPPATTPN
jgi:type IV secretion system protein VirB8